MNPASRTNGATMAGLYRTVSSFHKSQDRHAASFSTRLRDGRGAERPPINYWSSGVEARPV